MITICVYQKTADFNTGKLPRAEECLATFFHKLFFVPESVERRIILTMKQGCLVYQEICKEKVN